MDLEMVGVPASRPTLLINLIVSPSILLSQEYSVHELSSTYKHRDLMKQNSCRSKKGGEEGQYKHF